MAGDSNRSSWEDRIVPNYSDEKEVNGKKQDNLLDSTILHASHHGSKYFFVAENDDDDDRYKESMEKIKPEYTIISVGAGNNHGHPHRIATNIYKDKTLYNRVYTTKNEKSMYFALNKDGSVEFKKDLSEDDFGTVTHKTETNSLLVSSAATLSFEIDKNIDFNLPKTPPKAKREGYR